jgi:hypothetical protein
MIDFLNDEQKAYLKSIEKRNKRGVEFLLMLMDYALKPKEERSILQGEIYPYMNNLYKTHGTNIEFSSMEEAVKWLSKPTLFTTQDGVEIKKGDTYWTVIVGNFSELLEIYWKPVEKKVPEHGMISMSHFNDCYHHFSTKELAEKYISENKPKEEQPLSFDMLKDDVETIKTIRCLSINDIVYSVGVPYAFVDEKIMQYLINLVKEIELSKSKEPAKNTDPLYTKKYFLQELEKAFTASREISNYVKYVDNQGTSGNAECATMPKFLTFNDYLNSLK